MIKMNKSEKPLVLYTFEICDKVETQGDKKNLQGLFDTINVLGIPALHPSLTIILGFSKGVGQHKGKLAIQTPSGSQIAGVPFDVKFNGNTSYYAYLSINALPLPEVGKYLLIVYLDENKLAERELYVKLVQPKEFSEEEIRDLLSKPSIVKEARAEIICPNCGTKYKFQINLDHKKPLDKDAVQFPADDIFKCPNDDFQINVLPIKSKLKYDLGRSIDELRGG